MDIKAPEDRYAPETMIYMGAVCVCCWLLNCALAFK